MVATLPFMIPDEHLAASPSPTNAMEAQKAALAAQQQAEDAQREALKMQAAESGLTPPMTADERLKAASEAVQLAQ